MRRSDEEFKAELKARARTYRAMREKRRVEAVKGISALMAACMLIVVVSQVDFSWGGNLPEESTEVTVGENESSGGDVSQTEESEPETSENHQTASPTVGAEEDESQEESVMKESVGNAAADSLLDKIMVRPGNRTHWNDGKPDGVESYEASEAAQKLANFLKELDRFPRKEEAAEEGVTDGSQSLESKFYEVKVFYEDRTQIYYRMILGEETKWVRDDVILLDQQTWEEWMTLYEAVKSAQSK